ncbi:TAXI family TRAP transporter solute-binding subunit [Carboxylicivirga marina]|uniref:ABC transporter substrate-binding protein n=1 Tax=Carboxylicivirga marina TaxID=2800988 RepID=A0ABS1HIW5_9BACT|nr:TAXI family TRAP transporter solute-binding subunit [Carboxylicivirga marina]MBK3517604.1 ABC transporter substrate-binding protein [Carboxylicivirga marina]
MNTKFSYLLTLLVVFSINSALAQFTIFSGPLHGSYNKFADDIVKIVGEKEGIELINQPTHGSAANFRYLIDPDNEAKMVFIQSDYFSLMQAQDLVYNTHKTGALKIVMPLAKEQIHIFTKKSTGIKTLEDLKDKRLAVGTDDQSSSFTAEIIRKRSKVEWFTNKVNYDQMLKRIASGNVEAGIMVGSSPLEMLQINPQVMVDGLVLLQLRDFNGWAKSYENDVIKAGEYEWLEKDIDTFSLRTLLIVNEDKLTEEDKKVVEAIEAGIAKNIAILQKEGHPKWSTVEIESGASVAPAAK